MAQKTTPPDERVPRSLLDLSTFVVRDFITIDGEKFDLKNRDELSLIEFAAIQAAHTIADKIQRESGDNVSADEQATLREVTDKIVGMITIGLRLSPKFDLLTDGHKAEIIHVFTRLLAEQREAPGEAEAEKSTGESKSLGSNGSTAATPSAG